MSSTWLCAACVLHSNCLPSECVCFFVISVRVICCDRLPRFAPAHAVPFVPVPPRNRTSAAPPLPPSAHRAHCHCPVSCRYPSVVPPVLFVRLLSPGNALHRVRFRPRALRPSACVSCGCGERAFTCVRLLFVTPSFLRLRSTLLRSTAVAVDAALLMCCASVRFRRVPARCDGLHCRLARASVRIRFFYLSIF